MMMFFGAISSRSSGASCCRRQRLRRAMATARLAAFWPTMYLSSSRTISFGVSASAGVSTSFTSPGSWMTMAAVLFGAFDRDVVIGVDADGGGDLQGLCGDLPGAHRRMCGQSARGGERIRAAAADGQNPVVRLDEISGAGDQVGPFAVGDDEERLKLPQVLVHPPVFGQLHDGPFHVAAILFELRLEAGEKGEGIGGGAGKAGQDLVVKDAPHSRRAVLHDGA